MKKEHAVTGIIPAKNEQATIQDVIAGIKPFVDEILVVDGHSLDETREIAAQMGARVLLDHGKGKGDGIREGIHNASGDILVCIDADGSHDPKDIPKLVWPIMEGNADLVIGSRATGGSDELHGDFPRFIRFTGSYLLLLAINYRWNVRITDCQNGFRAIKTDVARALGLQENIHTIEEEMVMKCLQQGYVIGEVPSHEYTRKHGVSTLRLTRVWERLSRKSIHNIHGCDEALFKSRSDFSNNHISLFAATNSHSD